jgi:hypothetical protein
LKPLCFSVMWIGWIAASFNDARAQLDFTTQTDSRFRPRPQGESLFERQGSTYVTSQPNSLFAQQTPHPAVVRVIVPEPGGASLGSGTLVDANDESGLVVTNWHVVKDARQGVLVVFPDGFQSMGRVLRMDNDWDLAGVLIKRPTAAPVKLASEPPQIGESLTIAGYGGGNYRSQTGRCTQYLAPSLRHPFEIVECAATARQGDSGGPIFNSRGELAGVLFGEGGGRTSGTYCGRVHQFLLSATSPLRQGTPAQVASLPPTDSAAVTPNTNTQPAPTNNGWRPRRSYGESENPTTVASILPAATEQTRPGDTPTSKIDSLPPYEPVLMQPTATVTKVHTPVESQTVTETKAQSPPAVASIAASPVTPSHLSTTPTIAPAQPNPSQREVPAAARNPRSDLTWQLIAGDTFVAQAKTVFAGLGVLAFLFHGARLLARTTAPAHAKRKRSSTARR